MKKRKTKGKKVVSAPGSEKDPQAVTDTRAKRTFLEVSLGDDPVPGKKEEQDLLEKQKFKDSETMMIKKLLETLAEDDTITDFQDAVKHDLEKATKPQPKAKSNTAGIEAKAAFIERKEKRLIELEGDIKKAELSLKERLESLDSERVLLAKMRAELLQNTGTSANMDTDASIDELERKVPELRKFASACQQSEFGKAENEVKRYFGKLESYLGFEMPETEHGCNRHV